MPGPGTRHYLPLDGAARPWTRRQHRHRLFVRRHAATSPASVSRRDAPSDPLGQLTLARERCSSRAKRRRRTTLRWQDYTQTAVDPTDDCTIWYVGDYLKKDATSYSIAHRRVSDPWVHTMTTRHVLSSLFAVLMLAGCTQPTPEQQFLNDAYDGARRQEPHRSREDADASRATA